MSISSQETILELVDLTYAAACDPAKWPWMLQSLCTAIGAAGADLGVVNLENASAQFRAGVGIIDAEFMDEYDHHLQHEPFLMAAKRMKVCHPGTVVVSELLVPTRELEHTEFYNEFGRRYEYVGGMSGIISRDVNGIAAINICRRTCQRLGAPDVRLIHTLLPHLARALQIHERLSESETRIRALHEALDRLATAALLVEQSGRVVFANHCARSIVAANDGLTVDRGTLRADRPRDTTALMAMVGGAAETASGRGLLSGGVLLLGRPSGRRPLQLIVAPLSGRSEQIGREPPCAIVFVCDPERMPETDVAVLRRMHGLSRAEAEVARLLLQDETALEIAEILSISTNTVRFHLKQLFAKTGTHRQSELVRVLLASTHVRG